MTPFCVDVDDALVKHQTVFLVLGGQFHLFQRLITMKVIGVCHRDGVCSFLLFQRGQDVCFHGFVIEFFTTADVQREPSDLAAVTTSDGLVRIIFCSTGDKCFDGIAIKFISHFAQKVARLYLGLTRAPGVDDRVCVVVENLLFQAVEVTVKFQTCPARCEARNKNVGLGVGWIVLWSLLKNHLQNVIGAHTEGLNFVCPIGEDVEQFMGLFQLEDLGLVGPFPKLSPKTVQHQFRHLLPPRIFGHVLQGNAFFLFVLPEVVILLLLGLAPPGPTGGLLFQLQPRVHVISKQSLLRFGKVPDFVDALEGVPPGHCFLKFGGTPRALKLALLIRVMAFGATVK